MRNEISWALAGLEQLSYTTIVISVNFVLDTEWHQYANLSTQFDNHISVYYFNALYIATWLGNAPTVYMYTQSSNFLSIFIMCSIILYLNCFMPDVSVMSDESTTIMFSTYKHLSIRVDIYYFPAVIYTRMAPLLVFYWSTCRIRKPSLQLAIVDAIQDVNF